MRGTVARHISTFAIAAAIGVPWTFGLMQLGHSDVPWIVRAFLLPGGVIVGATREHFPTGVGLILICAIQVIYYGAIALALKAAFFRLFFDAE
jgi:hypothetical protein